MASKVDLYKKFFGDFDGAKDVIPDDGMGPVDVGANLRPEDTAGKPFGYASDEGFRNASRASVAGVSPGTTVLPSRGFSLANRQDYTPEQEGVIRSAALGDVNKRPGQALTGTFNGQSFTMAPSQNIGRNRAQAYLNQDSAARFKAQDDALLLRKQAQEDADRAETAKDRQAGRNRQASQDRLAYTQAEQGYAANENAMARGNRTADRQDKLLDIQAQNAQRDLTEGVSPRKQAQQIALQKLLENPSLSPTSKAAIQSRLMEMTQLDLPSDVSSELSREAPGENANAAMAVANSPLVAPIIQRAILEAKNVHSARSIDDRANNESAFGSLLANPYRLAFGGRGMTNASTSNLEGIFAQALQAAKQQNPQADEGTLRQVIANQIMAEVPQDNTQAAAEIARALGIGRPATQPVSAMPQLNPSPGAQLATREPGGGPAF